MTVSAMPPVPAIDIVSGIWTQEALSFRPGWQEQFFAGKMKSKTDMGGVSLEQHLEQMDSAGIERAFLFAPKVGRKGLPGSFHLPYEIVARAVEKYPGRFLGLAGMSGGVIHDLLHPPPGRPAILHDLLESPLL